MKDLIIGMIIGILLTITVFYHFSLSDRMTRAEARLDTQQRDITSINLKVGPLPDHKGRR